MGKPKQLTRPPKKAKANTAILNTADDFQEAADAEEETGGKWRAGDPAKSGRAFVRALEIYDKGIDKHPNNFDLAYNRARLQLEITQQPNLVAHIGVPPVDLLQQTLESHRYALKLNDANPDILFNTSQVLATLAEHVSDDGDAETAVPLLHEALELLSSCLSRQEMLLEQHQADFGNMEEPEDEGGVPVEEQPGSTSDDDEDGEMVTVESPITPTDLIDTVHASLTAMTTLVSLTDPSALQTLGDMAQSLTELKVPGYLKLLDAEEQSSPQMAINLEKARFVAAFADAQYGFSMIDLDTYVARLTTFEGNVDETDSTALGSEAEARTELVLSVLANFSDSPDLPVDLCWKQLSAVQSNYAKAAKLETTSQLSISRGDVEMLRHRIASVSNVKIPENIRKNAPVLAQNAQTYYRSAVRLASSEDAELKTTAHVRTFLLGYIRNGLYGAEIPSEGVVPSKESLQKALFDCVEDQLLDPTLAEEISTHIASK